jgi:pyridoxal phosphate enzyme (YggS family)
MPVNTEKYNEIAAELKSVALVAVSKTKPIEDIEALYELGQKDFGENYVQELVDKEAALPKEIHWHFIGHLQSNKVKYIAPFIYMIHGIDSLKLLTEVNKQAIRCNRVIDCLLQVHIAQEETKFGMDERITTSRSAIYKTPAATPMHSERRVPNGSHQGCRENGS